MRPGTIWCSRKKGGRIRCSRKKVEGEKGEGEKGVGDKGEGENDVEENKEVKKESQRQLGAGLPQRMAFTLNARFWEGAVTNLR